MDLAFEYIETHPLMTEAEYPYTGKHTILTKCKYDASQGIGTVTNYNDVTANSPSQLMAAIEKQPVSIAVEADKNVF